MCKSSLLTVIASALLGISAQIQAGTYTADFSSSIIDPNLTATPRLWSVTSGGGVLDFSIAGNTTLTQQNGNAKYNQYLTGDFVATVSVVHLSSTPGVIAQLFFDGSSNFQTNISAYKQRQPSPYNTSLDNIGGWDPITNNFPRNVFGLGQVSELRLSRTGDIFTESYLLAGADDFTVWHTFDGGTWHGMGGLVGVAAGLHPTTTAADVQFSDFTITTNVPEPTSTALVGLGVAGLGFIRRRKAQHSSAFKAKSGPPREGV